MIGLRVEQQVQPIYLGRIVKAFGIRGELKFVGSDDFWVGVLESKRIYLQKLVDGEVEHRDLELRSYRPHGGCYVMKIAGIDDRNAAEREVGSEFFIDSDAIDVDLPDRELPFQVIGATIQLEGGRRLGVVRSMVFSSAHPVYGVETEDGEVLVPSVPEFIVSRDDAERIITIRPIPGLIDG